MQKERRSVARNALLALVSGLFAALSAGANDSDLQTPTDAFWRSNVSAAEVAAQIAQGFRPTDIEIVPGSPVRFSAAFVRNTGEYKSSFWWYSDQTGASLGQLVTQLKARITDLEVYHVNGERRLAAILVPNTGTQAKGWWWYHGLTYDGLLQAISSTKGRMVDIEQFTENGSTLFAAVLIANTGADQRGWWHFENVSSSYIAGQLNTLGARIVDLERIGTDRYVVVLNRVSGERWGWYLDRTEQQLRDEVDRTGARIIDLERYTTASGTRFAAVVLNNTDAEGTRVGDLLRQMAVGGQVGVYARELGGPVIASLQPARVFEPASTIKVLHHTAAMLAVQNGQLTLDDRIPVCLDVAGEIVGDGVSTQFPIPIPWQDLERLVVWRDNANGRLTQLTRTGSDPDYLFVQQSSGWVVNSRQGPISQGRRWIVQDPTVRSIADCHFKKSLDLKWVVEQTMMPSNNQTTHALFEYFGQDFLNQLAMQMGMTDTLLRDRVGGDDFDAPDKRNETTLQDLGTLYESMRSGLDPEVLDTTYELMIDWSGPCASFPHGIDCAERIVDEEAAALGLDALTVVAFKAELHIPGKAGSAAWYDATCQCVWRSYFGIAEVPFRSSMGEPAPRRYVHGAFIDFASAVNFEAIAEIAHETLRGPIREALTTWACPHCAEVRIGLEAEAVSSVTGMIPVSDGDASGGRMLAVVPGTPEGIVRFDFDLAPKGGDDCYGVWARVEAGPTAQQLGWSTDQRIEAPWTVPARSGDRFVWSPVVERICLDNGHHTLSLRSTGHDVAFDRVLITNGESFVPYTRFFEAESGALSGPMQLGIDSEAYCGAFALVPDGAGSGGAAGFDLDLPADASYTAWGRESAPDGSADSFHVAFDGGTPLLWDMQQTPGWVWDRVNDRGRGDVTVLLGSGAHHVEILQREDGAMLDRLLVSNDLGFSPANLDPPEEDLCNLPEPALALALACALPLIAGLRAHRRRHGA